MAKTKLTLQFTPDQADAHFRALAGQIRHSGQALAAITALQAFISTTASVDEQSRDAYLAIKDMIDQHVASARSRVMQDNLVYLLEALGERSLEGVQNVHAALSRNGFHQTVLAAIRQLSDEALLGAANWAVDWHHDARARAEASSGFPDALDLRGAGISPARFAAMSELNTYLQEAVSGIR